MLLKLLKLLITLDNSWNPLEMYLKLWNSWCSWNSWNTPTQNGFKMRPLCARARRNGFWIPFPLETCSWNSWNTLETLDNSCYLLKCSWNVLETLETLDTLETLETTASETRLQINGLPDLAVGICYEFASWSYCTFGRNGNTPIWYSSLRRTKRDRIWYVVLVVCVSVSPSTRAS